MDNLKNPETEKSVPKTPKVIFRVLGGIFLLIAFLSLLFCCLMFLLHSYQEAYGIIVLWWMPLFMLGLAGTAFMCGWGLWRYQKWSVTFFGIIFGVVLVAQIAQYFIKQEGFSASLSAIIIAICVTGGMFALTFFLRRHLKGAYFKWLPFSLFICFFLLNQISYPLFLLIG